MSQPLFGFGDGTLFLFDLPGHWIANISVLAPRPPADVLAVAQQMRQELVMPVWRRGAMIIWRAKSIEFACDPPQRASFLHEPVKDLPDPSALVQVDGIASLGTFVPPLPLALCPRNWSAREAEAIVANAEAVQHNAFLAAEDVLCQLLEELLMLDCQDCRNQLPAVALRGIETLISRDDANLANVDELPHRRERKDAVSRQPAEVDEVQNAERNRSHLAEK